MIPIVLHISPIVLGGGTPLFTDGDRVEFVQTNVRPSASIPSGVRT